MQHPHDLPVGAFPFLPGESARLPGIDPVMIWGERRDIPPWVTLVLKLLSDGADPRSAPHEAWVSEVQRYGEVMGAMRSVAEEQLKISASTVDERNARGEVLRSFVVWTDRSSGASIEQGAALERIWPIYCDAILHDLGMYKETPSAALERLERHWGQYQQRREAAFLADYMDRDVWQPAMAAAWIMFGGRSDLMARFFNCGAELRTSGVEFLLMGSSCEAQDLGFIHEAKPAAALLTAIRRSKESSARVVAKGYLYPDGAFAEISPAELSSFVWDENTDDVANLLRDDWRPTNRTTVYTGVVIDRDSLFKSFPSQTPNNTIAAEKRAEKQLRGLVAAGGSLPVGEKWREQAKTDFGVSGHGAKRAWDNVAADYPALKSPAGKPKSRRVREKG